MRSLCRPAKLRALLCCPSSTKCVGAMAWVVHKGFAGRVDTHASPSNEITARAWQLKDAENPRPLHVPGYSTKVQSMNAAAERRL